MAMLGYLPVLPYSSKRLDQPLGAVEPSVLQVPVLPVVECDVRPVRAVDRDGYRGSDVVAALVVDGGLRP